MGRELEARNCGKRRGNSRLIGEGETPNPKLQSPKKLQTPISKTRSEKWCLKLGASLEFGVWNLEFLLIHSPPP
jgi:hypothetical protein